MQDKTLPQEAVDQDHKLETSAERATEKLARHRWHWTLDVSNPDRVSCPAYARAVDRNKGIIYASAKGWVIYSTAQGTDDELSIPEAIWRARMSAERQEVVEVVAEVRDRAFTTVASNASGQQEVVAVHNIAKEKSQNTGQPFSEAVREVAQQRHAIKETTDREFTERKNQRVAKQAEAEKKSATFWQYVNLCSDLEKARAALRRAGEAAAGVDFTEEELDTIRGDIEKVDHYAGLLKIILAGDSVDWDAELASMGGGEK